MWLDIFLEQKRKISWITWLWDVKKKKRKRNIYKNNTIKLLVCRVMKIRYLIIKILLGKQKKYQMLRHAEIYLFINKY